MTSWDIQNDTSEFPSDSQNFILNEAAVKAAGLNSALGKRFRRTLASVKKIWDKAIPAYPFEFNFLDETIDAKYMSEQRLELILRIFTILAIAISCFGLFGMASFTAEQKIKEIRIRRVLGASVGSGDRLLTKEFVMLIILANVIAWPAAYIVMTKWLKNFAYRTDIGIGTFRT